MHEKGERYQYSMYKEPKIHWPKVKLMNVNDIHAEMLRSHQLCFFVVELLPLIALHCCYFPHFFYCLHFNTFAREEFLHLDFLPYSKAVFPLLTVFFFFLFNGAGLFFLFYWLGFSLCSSPQVRNILFFLLFQMFCRCFGCYVSNRAFCRITWKCSWRWWGTGWTLSNAKKY